MILTILIILIIIIIIIIILMMIIIPISSAHSNRVARSVSTSRTLRSVKQFCSADISRFIVIVIIIISCCLEIGEEQQRPGIVEVHLHHMRYGIWDMGYGI
jgi:hypothetical protein